jgi:hypothetical protein
MGWGEEYEKPLTDLTLFNGAVSVQNLYSVKQNGKMILNDNRFVIGLMTKFQDHYESLLRDFG